MNVQIGPDYIPVQPERANHIGQAIVPAKVTERVEVAVPDGEAETGASVAIARVTPTQVRRPWRATIRTVFAVTVAIAAMAPFLVEASGVEESAAPVVGFLAIAGGVTRVMALPQVETFLRRFLPFLAATPKEKIR